MKNAKSRYFSLVTYITDTERLVKLLVSKGGSVRAYALIKHDKDETDPHHHIVIRTHSNWTPAQVGKWFTDTETHQNTFCEVVHDRTAIVEYLTHSNTPEKAPYNESDIIDGGLADILPTGNTSDDCAEIIEKMLTGVPVRELVKLYGRDFVYHYGAYVTIVQTIRDE